MIEETRAPARTGYVNADGSRHLAALRAADPTVAAVSTHEEPDGWLM